MNLKTYMQVNKLKTVKLVIDKKNHEKQLVFNNGQVMIVGNSVVKITGNLEVSLNNKFVYDASMYKNLRLLSDIAQEFNDTNLEDEYDNRFEEEL